MLNKYDGPEETGPVDFKPYVNKKSIRNLKTIYDSAYQAKLLQFNHFQLMSF